MSVTHPRKNAEGSDAQRGGFKKLMLVKDWRETALGDMKYWPGALRYAYHLCQNSEFPALVWWSDKLLNIYNEAFTNVFNLKDCDKVGCEAAQALPQLFEKLGPTVRSVLADATPLTVHKKIDVVVDHATLGRDFTFYNTPIQNDAGDIEGVFTTVIANKDSVKDFVESTPATGRAERIEGKGNSRRIRRNDERYLNMIEEVEDYAIILLDKDGTILNWNKGAEKIKGYTDDEIIGNNFSIFYLEEDKKEGLPQKLIQTATETGRAAHEGLRRRKDGTLFWGSIVITALHDDNNNVIGFTKVTRDLTERKNAEDLVKQHAAELEMKNKQLEQFAYIASHDLQEPLRKIQTFVQILEKKIDDRPMREKYFAKINLSANRMADLIHSVLNYSRLNQQSILSEDVDLNGTLESVIGDYELLIAEKKAIIEHTNLPIVRGIPLQLSQLFGNLLANSLKFSLVVPRITVSAKKVPGARIQKEFSLADARKDYVEIIFSDNGIGFEQQYADRIFTIFQRLNSRDEFAGTGIGLALCKKIVENHSGHIIAKSELGKGASFFIYLPHK